MLMAKVENVDSVQAMILKINPPVLVVEVQGWDAQPGWSSTGDLRLRPPEQANAEGVLEFDFVGWPPLRQGDATPTVISSIEARVLVPLQPGNTYGGLGTIHKIVVHARKGSATATPGSNEGPNPPARDLSEQERLSLEAWLRLANGGEDPFPWAPTISSATLLHP